MTIKTFIISTAITAGLCSVTAVAAPLPVSEPISTPVAIAPAEAAPALPQSTAATADTTVESSAKQKVRQLFEEYDDEFDEDDPNKPKCNIFISGIYLGWGSTSHYSDLKDATRVTRDFGVLNAVGVSLRFNRYNRLSLGVGYQMRTVGFYKGVCLRPGETSHFEIGKFPSEYSHTSAHVRTHTIQFPLLYARGFGHRLWAFAGPVMNWNIYTSYKNGYRLGDTDYSNTTNHLKQRKVSFDALVGLSWHSLGLYFRYSPQTIFKDPADGPKLDKTWTLGIILGF